jgi:hypothetical protein|nr:MAG TPA: hypothetical protein [Caudoviricetes sp.]
MKNLILRYKMYRLLTKMLDAERSGKTMLSACNLPKDKGILFALQEVNCIEIDYADNKIWFIRRGEKPYLYLIERSELLVNRIISFILGIASTLIVEAAIRILFSAQ